MSQVKAQQNIAKAQQILLAWSLTFTLTSVVFVAPAGSTVLSRQGEREGREREGLDGVLLRPAPSLKPGAWRPAEPSGLSG